MRKFWNIVNRKYVVFIKIWIVIVVDFDNNGDIDIFMNNICSYCDFNDWELNKLFIVILN